LDKTAASQLLHAPLLLHTALAQYWSTMRHCSCTILEHHHHVRFDTSLVAIKTAKRAHSLSLFLSFSSLLLLSEGVCLCFSLWVSRTLSRKEGDTRNAASEREAYRKSARQNDTESKASSRHASAVTLLRARARPGLWWAAHAFGAHQVYIYYSERFMSVFGMSRSPYGDLADD